jgi:predicted transcriptional regulator
MSDPDIDSIPDLEPEDEAEAARLDAEAEAAAAEGRVVPHERVREWLIKLSKGIREPPPRA